MESVSCVIITYNVDEKIYDVIHSLRDQVNNIIIVDNGSKKDTISILNSISKIDNIDIIYNRKNLGIAAALNIGIKRAIEKKSKWILTLDHDSLVEEKMVCKLIDFYNGCSDEEKSRIGILAPEVFDIAINKSFYNVEDKLTYKEVRHVIQSGSLIKVEVFEKIGYFYEPLFIYFVDIEFCYKLIENNYKILMVKGARLLHEEGKKERKKFLGIEYTYDNYSIYAIYYITRNAIYMFKKYRKYEFIKRIIYDFIKISMAEPIKIRYVLLGIKDGLINNYGDKFN